MKEITEQQINERAKRIGDKPAFPVMLNKEDSCDECLDGGLDLALNGEYTGYTGMTYRQYLIGQILSHPDGRTDRVEYVLRDLAKAELEAEQEVGNG